MTFDDFWKQEIQNSNERWSFPMYLKLKDVAKRAYEQGRFDEANYIGACKQDTENKIQEVQLRGEQ